MIFNKCSGVFRGCPGDLAGTAAPHLMFSIQQNVMMKKHCSRKNSHWHEERRGRKIVIGAIKKIERKTEAVGALRVTPVETWLTVHRRRLVLIGLALVSWQSVV